MAMELINGTYYTPEDAKALRERQAAAAAEEEARALRVGSVIGTAQIEVSDDRLRGILKELLEPIVEAIEEIDGRLKRLEGASGEPDPANPAAGGDSTPAEGETPEDDGKSASGAGSADSGQVPEPTPAAAKAPAKPATRKGASK